MLLRILRYLSNMVLKATENEEESELRNRAFTFWYLKGEIRR